MSSVRADIPPTEFRSPGKPAEENSDVTLVRGRPPLIPAADIDDDVHDSPIARLILSHERPHAARAPKPDDSVAIKTPPHGLPVTVLTSDTTFANQVRSALEGVSEVSIVATADEATELTLSGRGPIFVTDTTLTRSAIESLKTRLRAHDPALTFIVAGSRDQGGLFIGLQSSGAIEGFLLKPVTAGAAQLLVDSATKRHHSIAAHVDGMPEPTRRSRTRPPRAQRLDALARTQAAEPTIEARVPTRAMQTIAPAAQSSPASRPTRRPSWLLMIAAVAAVGGIVWWVMWQRMPDIDPQRVITQHLALAAIAHDAGRWTGARDSAAHHYQTVLALDPQNFAAQRGMHGVAAELSKRTQALMARRQLAEAALSLERLRETQPDYAELPLLDSQLRLLQDSVLATLTPPPASEATPEKRAPSLPVRERPTTRAAERTTPERAPSIAPETAAVATQTAPTRTANRVAQASEAKQSAMPPAKSPAATAPASETALPPPSNPAPALVEPTSSASSTMLASTSRPSAPAITTPGATPGATSTDSPPATAPPTNAATRASGPALVKYVPPTYPTEAHARGLEGWVQVSLQVSPGGSVLHARVVDGEKRQLFTRAALAAVKEWQYEARPGATNETTIGVRIDFKLSKK